MVASSSSSSPERPVPNVYGVQASFNNLIKCGEELHRERLTAAQEQMSEVLREHTRALLYMETHGRPSSETAAGSQKEPACLVPYHAVYDSACKSIQDSIAGLEHAQHHSSGQENNNSSGPAEATARQTIHLLKCVKVLVHALGWALQPASPTQQTAITMSFLQHRFSQASAHATEPPSSSSTGDTSSQPALDEEATDGVAVWVRQAHTALSDLAYFATAMYPCGAWFGNRNRRTVVRSRQLRHPSDIGDAPLKALVLASHSVKDDDITLLSEAMLGVAQAHTICLAAVRSTESRPADAAALAALFAPLNNALNELSATCENVISRREDDRPHAHAVLEAGNVFTWLTTTQEPCVVAEEAFGSANTYLNKITARGNVLLLQQETGFVVDEPELIKAMVTWASMLREVLQRLMLMVVYRYPHHVPWGELLETPMPRTPPRPPLEQRGEGREGQPVRRRGASAFPSDAAPATAPAPAPAPAPAAPKADSKQLQPPPPPSAAAAAAVATTVAAATGSKAEEGKVTGAATDDAASPSCSFDAVTSTWTVEHYHQSLVAAGTGAEQEPIFVTLPAEAVQQSHFVSISHCFNAYVTVPKKVKGVAVEHCQHTKLQLAGAVDSVRITDTEKQEMLVEESVPIVYATRVSGLTLHLAGSHDTQIVTKLTTDVNVNVMVEMPDGDQEVRELALPAQFISTIGEGDTLNTKEVTYSG
ncbi:Adenylate cyclase associated (CAP) C terminal [Lotmaria passim]